MQQSAPIRQLKVLVPLILGALGAYTHLKMEVADSSVGRRREHAIRRNGICGRCMGKLSIAFICVWVLLFVLCLVSLLTCKFEVDIGIDSFQVEDKHPSVISLDAFESAQKEWKKMKEKAEKTDPRTDESRGKLMRRVLSFEDALKTYSVPRQLGPEKNVVRLRLLARLEVIFSPSSKVSVDEETGKRNVLSEKIFAQIHKIEKMVENVEGYRKFCRPSMKSDTSNGCVPPNSLLTFFYPSKSKDGNYVLDGRGDKLLFFDFTLAEVLNQKETYFFSAMMSTRRQNQPLL